MSRSSQGLENPFTEVREALKPGAIHQVYAPSKGEIRVGDFTSSAIRVEGHYIGGYEYWRTQEPQNRVVVSAGVTTEGVPQKPYALTTFNELGEKDTLGEKYIALRMRAGATPGDEYPKFLYTYLLGDKLWGLTVYLASDQYVGWHHNTQDMPRDQFSSSAPIPEEILARLPDRLVGLREVLGQEIPWKIDFRTQAERIIAESRFREFTETFRQMQTQ